MSTFAIRSTRLFLPILHAPHNSCGTFTKDTVIVVGRDRKGSKNGIWVVHYNIKFA